VWDLCEFADLLTNEEKEIRYRVRGFCEEESLPVINAYWERAEFPAQLVKELGALGVAGGAIEGYG
jgi:glutaryl-CoA dehydrogenase